MAVIAEYQFGTCRVKVEDDRLLPPEEQKKGWRKVDEILIREAVIQERERRSRHE